MVIVVLGAMHNFKRKSRKLKMEEIKTKCHECGTKQKKDNGIIIDGARFIWGNHDVWFCNQDHKEIWIKRNQKAINNEPKSK